MNTSNDEFDRRDNGILSPNARVVPNVIPEVDTPFEEENNQKGVSTNYVTRETSPQDLFFHWYALRCTYGREKKAYEYLLLKGIECFYPTKTKKIEDGCKRQLVEESRIPNIFFAHSSFDTLKQYVYDNVHDETKHIRFYYNQHHDGSKEPLIIPDFQIRSLRIICDSEENDIILEPITAEKFLKGQRVIVKEGPFAGVEGIVARFMGQQRVGISIEGLLTMATAYVPSGFLERII